jgi:hypothetical protein
MRRKPTTVNEDRIDARCIYYIQRESVKTKQEAFLDGTHLIDCAGGARVSARKLGNLSFVEAGRSSLLNVFGEEPMSRVFVCITRVNFQLRRPSATFLVERKQGPLPTALPINSRHICFAV